jgi:catechol 2,3-dioxygenase-like lactoylglutathione lyase family enzyme
MTPNQIQPLRIDHIGLRVRDLKRSAVFYCELFGLERRPTVPPSDSTCLCVAPSGNGSPAFGITLIQGLPLGVEPISMDHFSFEVRSAEDVLGTYCAALVRGAQATEPRMYGGHYQTFIFDPDGYKVEVVSRDTPLPHEVVGREMAKAGASRHSV